MAGAVTEPGDEPVLVLGKTDRTAIVVRHNMLLESKHTLTLMERRFVLWIVSQINSDDANLKAYRIGVTEWFRFCGQAASKDHYGDALRLVQSLVKRHTLIKDDRTKKYSGFPWFGRVTYAHGDGYIEATLNPNLKPYLLQMKTHFTRMTLECAVLIDSVHAGRIYDLLKQYERIGERTITVDDLRSMLELTQSYPNFADFRKRVLDVAEREINAKTDIRIAQQEIKAGRKVAAIRFQIRPQVPAATGEVPDAAAAAALERLLRHGVAGTKARVLLDAYPLDRIDRNLDQAEHTMRAKGNVENAAGFVIKAIEQDWHDERSVVMAAAKKTAAAVTKQVAKKTALARAVAAIEDEYAKYAKMAVRLRWRGLAASERQRIEHLVRERVASGTVPHADVVARKLERAIVGDKVEADLYVWLCFVDVLKAQFPDLKVSLLEFARRAEAHPDLIAALAAQAASAAVAAPS